jgi:hypothetical protein
MTYLITYELFRPGQNYHSLFAAIRSVDFNAQHPMNHTWFVRTNLTAVQINNTIRQHVDYNDKLFICQVTEYSSTNMGQGNWLGI